MISYKFVPNDSARAIFNEISKDTKSFITSDPELSVVAAVGDAMFEKHVKNNMPKKVGKKPKKLFTNCDSGYKHIDGINIGTIQKLDI